MAKSITLDVKDIYSLTDFLRNTKAHTARLKKSKTPMVLTVNGSASLIAIDAATYQEMLDRLKELEEIKFKSRAAQPAKHRKLR